MIVGKTDDLTKSKNGDKDGVSGAEKPVSVSKEEGKKFFMHIKLFFLLAHVFMYLFYLYYFCSHLEVQVSNKQRNSRKPMEMRKADLCNDIADEGGCSEKQR